MNIILFGSPGAGKGTQAVELAKKFNLVHIETGAVLREIARKRTFLGRKIKKTIERGELVPEALVVFLLIKKIQNLSMRKRIILDGSPRTLAEAEMLSEILTWLGRKERKVFFIKISDREAIKRLVSRLTCPRCKRTFSQKENIEKCKHCRTKLIKRKDDSLKVIRKRIIRFKKQTLPAIKYYQRKKELIEINGEQSKEKVYQDILEKLH